jgi:HAE1 family hydrophobic/amphiphilic exporter-1
MKNRALIALVTLVAAVFGLLALTGLKQELAPSLQFPQLAIVTTYSGASPAVVDHDVSQPIENAIQTVPNLESASAVSSTNSSVITAQFRYGTDLGDAEHKLDQAVSRISSSLPDGVDPQVLSVSTDELPVVELAVSSDQDAAALADSVDRLTIPVMKKIDGVGDVTLLGASGRRVTITPDDAKLAAHGLTVDAIRAVLQQNGQLVPGGSLTQAGKTLTVQTGQRITSVSQLTALPLLGTEVPGQSQAVTGQAQATPAGSPTATPGGQASVPQVPGSASRPPAATASPAVVTLGDVATVRRTANPVTSLSRVNGKPALTLAVTKLPSANTVDLSSAITAKIPSLQKSLGDTTKITVVFDQAPFITRSINSLADEGILGLGFAVIVILLFLFSVRSTLVTAISIPTSLLITFIGMQAAGYTLNIITLGGLTIAIGRVVDDAIVVIENIKRHLADGGERTATIITAVREVAGAITASTLTTVAVFLPVAFVGDVTGELFRPFALTVTIALLASLLVALTIVPVLAYWFLRRPRAPGVAPAGAAAAATLQAATVESAPRASEKPTRLQRGYLPIIHWTLRHSVVTVILAVVVLAGTAALAPVMKTNFLGDEGQDTMSLTRTMPPGTSLAAMESAARPVETMLRRTEGVTTVQVSIGSSGSALQDAFTGGGAGTIVYSVTTDPNADQGALQKRVERRLKKTPGGEDIRVTSSSGFGASSDINVDVSAPTASKLTQAAQRIQTGLDRAHEIKQTTNNLSASLPYLAVDIDKKKAAEVGLSEAAIGTMVSQAVQPSAVGNIVLGDATVTVYLASAHPPKTVAALRGLLVETPAGRQVRLDRVASVRRAGGPASITTEKGLRTATIGATPSSDNLATANAAVQRVIDTTTLPEGATASIGGVTSEQTKAFSQLGLALLAAILIVYVIMVATFKSLRQPLLLLISVPFAATGSIVLQIVTGVPLGVASLIGVLMLIGIVVTNAIVLVDLVNQYRARGKGVAEAVAIGASLRLRPILMTALATIFALVPMAMGLTGHGGFISQPLALVVIGGLVSSTVLTLIVLPTLYNLVEGARERRLARRGMRVRDPDRRQSTP